MIAHDFNLLHLISLDVWNDAILYPYVLVCHDSLWLSEFCELRARLLCVADSSKVAVYCLIRICSISSPDLVLIQSQHAHSDVLRFRKPVLVKLNLPFNLFMGALIFLFKNFGYSSHLL
jgi:hypothetical protein